jgi:DNA-binding transcriptional ArsR family regulator
VQTDERREAVLDALGDRTRRAIVDLLVERPRAVAELAEELPVGRPAVSLHLKVLREAGLVKDKAMGTRRIYSVDPAGLELLRTYLERVWQGALANFAARAETEHRTKAINPTKDKKEKR